MANIVKIPIARDLRLGFFLTDNNGYIVSPRDNNTKIKLFVGEESFIASCDDVHGNYSYCEIQSAKIAVVNNNGYYRFPKNSNETTIIKSFDMIVLCLPSFAFHCEGNLKIAFCQVIPDDNFKDNTADVWSLAKDTYLKFVKK